MIHKLPMPMPMAMPVEELIHHKLPLEHVITVNSIKPPHVSINPLPSNPVQLVSTTTTRTLLQTDYR